MREVEVFVGLLVVVVLVALVGRRARVPHAVALVVGGIGVGLLPFAPDVALSPDLIFLVFLPPILYPSAFAFATEDVRSQVRPIFLLAVGLVLATIAAIALVAHLAIGVPWAAAVALGAVLAPTDPVSAVSVIRSSGAPEQLAVIIEGESLINDGTALTALRIAIAAVGGTFALGPAVGEFVLVAFGGAAVGAALGLIVSVLRLRLDDLELESAMAVLLAYGSFILAEQLGVSGILATVLAGWVMGKSSDVVSAPTRMGGESFWVVLQFLAESMLFLLIGLAFAQVLDDPATRSGWELAGLTALVAAVTIGIRTAWMFTVPYVAAILDSATPGRLAPRTSWRDRAVLSAAGLRGAVSVAAALSLPVAVQGTPFPERGTLIAVALSSIVVLLVLPALGLPVLLRALGLTGSSALAERERDVRAALAEAALERVDRFATERDVPGEVLDRVRERYRWRTRIARAGGEHLEGHDDRAAIYRDLRREIIDAQRGRLIDLREHGEVSGEVLRAVQRDLDLEETRVG